jgi:prolyl oligopeptidase
VDAANPSPSNWVDFIPETECIVSSTGAGFFFANYMKDAVSVVKQYDYNGN